MQSERLYVIKTTQKLLELINEFRKVAGYKINIQKSVSFVYIYNEISKKECKQFLLKSHQKIKYLGVNLTKQVKDIYAENYKTLIKEIEDDSKKGIFHALGLEELILLKWP